MPEGKDQDRTEPATPKKREDARRKGQVAVSREIPSVCILSTALGVFFFAGAWMFRRLWVFMAGVFEQAGALSLDDSTLHAWLVDVFRYALLTLSPLMGFILLAGFAGYVGQVGFLVTGEPLTPKLSKLNPISGIRRLFSLRSVVELGKALVKLILIGSVAFLTLRGELVKFSSLIHMDAPRILATIGHLSFKTVLSICLSLLLLAGLDYLYQRWQYEKDLRMTKQEVKEEFKQREGDPGVKSRIKRTQMELAQRRMMADVPKAQVVITNPTHLAVALCFDSTRMAAPRVVAKGAGYVATRIKDLAEDAGVPIVEQKPLARALFKSVEIGDVIPVELYRAAAEVLAYVYRLKGQTSA